MSSMRWFAELDPRQFLDAINRINDSIKSLERGVNQSFSAISSAFTDIVSVVGAGMLARTIYTAYETQINATRRLSFALSQISPNASEATERIVKLASEIQSVTNYGDEQMIAVAANIAKAGEVSVEAIEKSMSVVADIATMTGDSVESVADVLANALAKPEDAAARLKRAFGVIVPDETIEQIRLLADEGDLTGAQLKLLEELSLRFNGAAEELANPLTQVQGLMGDIAEIIGEMFVPTLKEAMTIVRNILKSFTDSPPIVKAFAAAAFVAVSVFTAFNAVMKITIFLKTTLAALMGPKGWVTLVGAVIAAAAAYATFNAELARMNEEAGAIQRNAGKIGEAQNSLLGGMHGAGGQFARRASRDVMFVEHMRVLGEPDREARFRMKAAVGIAEKTQQKQGKDEELRAMKAGLEDMIRLQSKWFGVDMTESQRRSFRALTEEINRTQDALDELSGANKKIEDLRHRIATFGMTQDEIALFDLRNLGASQQALEEIQALMRNLRQMEEEQKAIDAAKAANQRVDEMIQQTKDRLAVLRGEMDEIDVRIEQARREGATKDKLQELEKLLREEEAAKQTTEQKEEKKTESFQMRNVAAASAGSAQAISMIIAARESNIQKNMLEVAKKQLEVEGKQEVQLIKIANTLAKLEAV